MISKMTKNRETEIRRILELTPRCVGIGIEGCDGLCDACLANVGRELLVEVERLRGAQKNSK